MWFNAEEPWQGDLAEFRERMADRLQRFLDMAIHYEKEQHARCVADTKSLIAALDETLTLDL